MNTHMKRTVILEHLAKNRQAHADDFNLAIVEFRGQFAAGLRDFADQVEAGGEVKHPIMELRIPRSYDKEYEKAISALKMDTREEIELSNEDFDRLVLDRWPFTEVVETDNKPLAEAARNKITKH